MAYEEMDKKRSWVKAGYKLGTGRRVGELNVWVKML